MPTLHQLFDSDDQEIASSGFSRVREMHLHHLAGARNVSID